MAQGPVLLLCLDADDDDETTRLAGRLGLIADVTKIRGGIAALIKILNQTRDHPDLICLELNGHPADIHEALDQLKDHVSSNSMVCGFGRINDVGFYRTLLATGFKEYFVTPLQDDDFRKLTRLILNKNDTQLAPTIGFVSLAGGVGTSLVAFNFARYLARRSTKGVTLLHPQPQPYNALFASYKFEVTDRSEAIVPSLEEPHQDRPWEASCTAQTAEQSAEFESDKSSDTVRIVDVGTHVLNAEVLSQCDHMVVIGEPDYRSLINAKSLHAFLATHYPFATQHFALTKLGLDGRIEFSARDLENLIGHAPLLLYRYDQEALSDALAKPAPVLPRHLLSDQHAFETLSTLCRVPFKSGKLPRPIGSSLFQALRKMVQRRKIAHG